MQSLTVFVVVILFKSHVGETGYIHVLIWWRSACRFPSCARIQLHKPDLHPYNFDFIVRYYML